jgi:hypothetical protein
VRLRPRLTALDVPERLAVFDPAEWVDPADLPAFHCEIGWRGEALRRWYWARAEWARKHHPDGRLPWPQAGDLDRRFCAGCI